MKKEDAVQIVLLNKKGEVLAVSRKYDHNDFGLVGGKVDEGENVVEAAIRETKEETGLDISNLRCIYKGEKWGRMGYTFLADYSGTIHTDELHVVKWTTFTEINNGSFGEWNRVVTRILIEMGINIKLK